MEWLAANLAEVRSRIAEACIRCGREATEITLVAVSKTVADPVIRAAYDLGIRDFGESRLQEALPKIEQLPKDITWHFVGKIQSNKARRVFENFQVIHSVDANSQIQEFRKAEVSASRDVFVHVNVAKEQQKSGILPEALDETITNLLDCSHANFRGLMTIGPAEANEEQKRELFRTLRSLNQRVQGEWLSMGMSDDFDVAIQEGATHIRVGSAIFGARTQN